MQRFKTKKFPMKINETKKRARHSLKSRSPRSMGPLASTPAYMTSTHISVVAISKHVMIAVPMASKFWLLLTQRPPCSTHMPASRMNRSQKGHSQPARHSALQTLHSSDSGSEHASGQENRGSSSQSTSHCCTFSPGTVQNWSRHVVHCITLYPHTCEVSWHHAGSSPPPKHFMTQMEVSAVGLFQLAAQGPCPRLKLVSSSKQRGVVGKTVSPTTSSAEKS
mmetsp:Transcript_7963/g.17167  ORF Transcript_7963/g.17167 Transcript_7963/m.17167 type:complete len:222 (-) Transcript_7963:1086-1751(-)